MKRNHIYISILIPLFLLSSCTKEFLDLKPDKSQAVPSKLEEFQMLLDNYRTMNIYWPSVGEIASDNLYMDYTKWNALSDITAKNAHIWGEDLFNEKDDNDWSYSYISIFYTNVVLEGISKIEEGNSTGAIDDVKGQALFFRANGFYQLAQIFAKPYDEKSASGDLGIPLRLSSDLNIKSERASIRETYDRIITDAKAAASLLPEQPAYKTRPSRAAAYGLLARTYLSMGDYSNALRYADSCLQIQDTLVDFNTLDSAKSYPVPRFNDEVIFHSLMAIHTSFFSSSRGRVDSNLYKSYESNDLRKGIFFRQVDDGVAFRGSYHGASALFNGIAVDEMYFIRAECYARRGEVQLALNDLNKLSATRWEAGTFSPFTAADAEDALRIILTERRKELLCRGLRWTDLRRLNKEGKHLTTVKRVLNGNVYELLPNSPEYVFPIPELVITSSGIPQNPR